MKRRIRDYGIQIGKLKTGVLNKITDVKGVTVGHSTVSQGDIQTGVTAILPHQGNIFREKVIGAVNVINGFGKSIGTVQINELGTIETPILLTNTLSVGTAAESLIKYSLELNKEIGNTTGTVNPVVGECNDMYLNDIRQMVINEKHVIEALNSATDNFVEGAIGAGRGMRCFDLKGGIGSSSRVLELEHGTYTIGVLVLSNFGRLDQFRLNGSNVGKQLAHLIKNKSDKDQGSIMMIVATDLPVSHRQLKRIGKRASVGLSRTGSFFGNGSGDIVISFSTAQKILHDHKGRLHHLLAVDDEDLDLAFEAVADATEEAIYNSLICSETTTGREGRTLYSLADFMEEISY